MSRFSSWTNFRFTIGLRPSFCGVVLAILLSPATNPLHAFDTFAKVIPGLVDGLEDNVALQQAKTDSDGSTFVAGNILGSAQFSPTLSLPAPTLDRGRQTNDVFVGKLDPQGGWVWVQRVLIPVTDAVQPGLYTWFVPRRQVEVKDVAVTADAILVAGYFDSQEGRQVGFLVKLDKTGTRQWIRYVATISASRAANVNAVVAAPDGSVYFGGFCEPALAFIYRQSGNSHAVDNLATLGPAAGKTAYVAKLNSAGTFQWRLLGGASGTTSEETIALAIDGNNDVHALMNLGNGASVTNANNVLYRTVSSSFYVTPVAGKVSPGGAWMAFNDFDSGTDLAALPLTRNDVEREVRGTDLALIGGKAFVSGTATATGRKNLSGPLVTYRLGFLTRLGGDDYVSDNAVAYFINGRADSSLITHPTRIRGGGNRVYVTGPMPTTLQVYGENSPTSSSVGDLDLELLSLSDSDFVGAFDLSLRPLWLKTTSRATDVPRPNLFTGRLLAFALAQQRVLWGGSFRSGGSNLLLGQAPNELSLATSSADRVESWGWLTGITSEGDFLRQARLVVESAYEPIIINGEAQSTTRFEESYFQGTPITVRVADQVANDGGTRRKVTGFTLDNEVGTTAGNSLSLDLILDTTITFAWETQHRLLITSDHATAGLPATASPGSPTPLIGTNWLAEGTQVQATIDGVVYPIDQQAFGVRYKLKSYEVTLPAPTTTAISTPVERVAVQEFAMTRPATIAYSWSKQYSVTAQHSESSLRNLLVSRVLDGSGAEVSGSVVTSNGGERWFDAGSSIEFGALRSDEDIALKGWRYANPVSPGYFADGDFTIDTTATSDLQLDGELDLFRIGSADNNEYWVKRVANLTQPVTVFWNYGETVYVIHTGIGQTVSFSSAAPPMPATVGRWKELAVIQGPPGSNPDNMLIWDEATQTALPIRPGIVLAKWNTTQSGVEVVTQIFSGFPGEPWQDDPSQAYSGPNFYYHIANTPAVILDPSATDNRAFRGLLYSTGDGVAAGAQFSATQRGRSVLLFSTAPGIATGAVGEALEVRVVHTTLWNNDTIGLLNISQRATIGVKLSSAFDTAGKGTGYVMHRLANYNARIYDRDRVSGPIIPVNSTFDYPGTPRIPTEQDLVVVWYEKHDNIEWPARPVYYYGFDWPVAPSADATPLETDLKRIVIASRLGSEGLDAAGNRQLEFDPDRYEQVSVYHQPDRALPGFNPNEEHARIYPSLHASLSGRSVPAAYALRNDLNLSRELIAARGAPLNGTDYTSDPYVLVQYFDKQAATPEEAWKMAVYQVQRTAHVVDDYAAELPGSTGASYIFQYEMGAGELVVAPYPLNLVIGLSPCLNDSLATPNGSYFQDISANQRTWFVDHKGAAWAVSGDSAFEGRYYYRLQPDFWYPFDQDIGSSVKKVGDCIPFLPEFVVDHPRAELRRYGVFDPAEIVRATPSAVNYRTEWPDEVPVLKVGETLTYAGGENKADNSDAPGLPGIIGFAAGEIVFDSMNPSMNTSGSPSHRDHFMARIIAPLEERRISYATTNLPVHLRSPASSDITVDGDTWYFNQLPPSLQRRVFFKPLAKVSAADAPGVLVLRGLVNDRKLGDSDLTAAPPPVYLLEPNILNSRELQVLERVGGADPTWHDKVRALFDLSRNPASVDGSSGDWLVGVEPLPGQTSQVKPLRALGPGLALVTNPELLNPESSLTSGYVTIAENNHESLGEAPVTLHIIKVDATQLYRGAIKTMLPANVFDENITLRHTADFGGNVDQLTYEWWHREEDGAVSAGDVPPGGENGSPTWSLFADSEGGVGQSELELRGSPALLLADNLFFVRYHHRDASSESSSAWAGAANSSIRDLNNDGRPDYRAQLAMGWVKRVLDGVNPYEARIREFGRNDSPATTASLIAQLGAPFVGPVALNSSVDVIENLGLIELYETVLKRARDLSVDAENPSVTSGINAAILLASSRLADFYTALGREAWDDALDPTLGFSLDATIGFGNDTLDHGSLNSSRFCFENQLPTLLDEELALLRGTDESLGRPIFNRLFWNFTKGEGEVAYALNYQITDVTQDGFLDENDAMKLYPMGHGDAW
ncbi:MAG TPA: hypothetical protein PLX89_14875, partial [Verrucomicrobiota bacterium]|nr:hypothetical protein [Verrucomicrobiota bacterium]